MSLEIRKRGNKAYYYFEYSEDGKRRYLYLGTGDQHKIEGFKKALRIIRVERDYYSEIEAKLFGLLSEEERRQLKG